MKYVMTLTAAVLFIAATVSAAPETWTGKISDSMCGAKHSAGEHADKKVTDRDCTLKCVKEGEKYVFVSDGKVHQIANQNFKGLQTHAGHEVMLTGTMKEDAITVTKIEMPKKTTM